MEQIILIIHLLIAIALVGVVLVQRSEGGGLGMGGGGGNMGGMMSVRGSANLLTRVTTILAACFMGTSLVLAILSGSHSEPGGIVEETERTAPSGVPGEAPAGEAMPGGGDSGPTAPEEQPLSR